MPARSQPCDPIRKLYVFEVEGRGTFPIDMLRYDSCWPKSEGTDSHEVESTFRPRSGGITRKVTLIGLTEPTEARWQSFGWKVL